MCALGVTEDEESRESLDGGMMDVCAPEVEAVSRVVALAEKESGDPDKTESENYSGVLDDKHIQRSRTPPDAEGELIELEQLKIGCAVNEVSSVYQDLAGRLNCPSDGYLKVVHHLYHEDYAVGRPAYQTDIHYHQKQEEDCDGKQL